MRIGFLYLFLSLSCYSTLGILHKIAEVKKCRAESISLLMCGWSLVFVILIGLASGHDFRTPLEVAGLALPFGVCAGVAILSLQTALGLGNISTSWLAVNLSAGIPTILSIALYKEPVNRWKVFALVTMAVSMVLLWKDSQSQKESVANSPHE